MVLVEGNQHCGECGASLCDDCLADRGGQGEDLATRVRAVAEAGIQAMDGTMSDGKEALIGLAALKDIIKLIDKEDET